MPKSYDQILENLRRQLALSEWGAVFKQQAESALAFLTEPGTQLYWPYLFTLIGLMIFSYVYYRKPSESLSVKRFLAYALPKKIYTHKSALMDYKIYLLNHLFFSFPISMIHISYRIFIVLLVSKSLAQLTSIDGLAITWGYTTSIILLIITRGLIGDFMNFFVHRFLHKSPIFWPMHRLHHSAKVLTPITLVRRHPLLEFVGGFFGTTFWALFEGILFWIFTGPATITTVLGIHAFRTFFNFCGAALHHSHIWISFGPFWSHIFLSPAQHQIHHSANPKHYDKNFGEFIALWDWIFGTLYIPKEKEELEFGLGEDSPELHTTLASAYFEPVVSTGQNLYRYFKDKFSLPALKQNKAKV